MIQAVSFCRKCVIKTEYQNGNIPLKKDFFGGELKPETATLDHIKARSKGGRSKIGNYVILNVQNNCKKADKDVFEFATKEATEEYFEVMKNADLGKYTGEEYLRMISRTLRELWQNSPITKNLDMWEVLKRYE